MTRWIVWLIAPLLLSALVVGTLASRFHRRIQRLERRLLDPSPLPRDDGREASPPPEVVRAHALNFGVPVQQPARAFRLRQRCWLRSTPDEPWRELEADQVIAVDRPAFVWHATAGPGLLPAVRVVDSYVAGRGLLEARLFGVVPVARAVGPDADRGEALRYLAELPWAPDAWLHNHQLRWSRLDAGRLEVRLAGAPGRDTVRFRFAEGDPVEVTADARPRDEGGTMVDRPWRGRYAEFRTWAGRRIPTRAEVAWILDGEPFVYFRGEILDFAPIPPRVVGRDPAATP